MIGYLVGWGSIIGGFALYVTYQEKIGEFSKSMLLVLTLAILTFGFGLILNKSYRHYKNIEEKQKELGEGESYVRITPALRFTHDLIALLVFTSIIIFSQLSSEPFTFTDIIKAIIAGGGVYSLKWIYKDSFRE
jgi:hypothetical protein